MKDLQKYIEEQLSEIDVKSIVENEVKKTIQNQIQADVKRNLNKWTELKVQDIISTEIEIALNNPIQTDDGWGKKVDYPSFEDLFKKKFYEKLSSDYEIKRTIDTSVKKKVEDLYKESGKDFMNAFKDYLSKTIQK